MLALRAQLRLRARLRRRCRPAQQPLLRRRRKRNSRLRRTRRHALRVRPQPRHVQLTNPDGSCVPRDPTNPQLNQCIQVPLPVYGIASIGGDTSSPPTPSTAFRSPVRSWSRSLTTSASTPRSTGQLKQSPEGFASLTAPLYGCPVYNNGACQGGIPGSQVGFLRDIRPVSGTNFVPRMSLGGEISVIMPVVNAPFRLYYAYNPLRLYERPYCNDVLNNGINQSCSAQLITRDLFPRAAQATTPTRKPSRHTARATCSANPARPSASPCRPLFNRPASSAARPPSFRHLSGERVGEPDRLNRKCIRTSAFPFRHSPAFVRSTDPTS